MKEIVSILHLRIFFQLKHFYEIFVNQCVVLKNFVKSSMKHISCKVNNSSEENAFITRIIEFSWNRLYLSKWNSVMTISRKNRSNSCWFCMWNGMFTIFNIFNEFWLLIHYCQILFNPLIWKSKSVENDQNICLDYRHFFVIKMVVWHFS